MRGSIPQVLNIIAVTVLGIVLVLVIWQPVFPSGWIIQGMATQIDPGNLSLNKPAVLRFELAGKGGGLLQSHVVQRKGRGNRGRHHPG